MRIIVYCLLLLFLVTCKNNSGKTKTERIDYLAQKAFEDKEFIGNILVADQGEIIYKKSFGSADKENNLQNSDTTKFLIASVSKPITAILILRLVDKGILKLDDTLNKHFTNLDSKLGKISVHQLLSHTSGINEVINEEKGMDIKKLLSKATLGFEPGSGFKYSNSGYVILKEIAQSVTGKGYAELVQTEIFDPVGMTSSGVARNSKLDKIAKGYKDASQTEPAIIDFPLENIDGAGSVFSTTEDLYKLDRALYLDGLLSANMKEQMLKQHIPEEYGYGWFVRERGGVWDVYCHKGNLAGFASFITRRTQKNQFIIILSNAENADLSDIENGIHKILRTQD
ncbi:beta-lactamase family protein [Pontibacter sp. BT327]|uniref:Beta-lactamase family protein n=2 Tax=Pontibacter burrus TaxID=2704466 RepID=A0A6B3LKU0_9BACT|nr:beta-lactamase family protein [Pontibacter burrus]